MGWGIQGVQPAPDELTFDPALPQDSRGATQASQAATLPTSNAASSATRRRIRGRKLPALLPGRDPARSRNRSSPWLCVMACTMPRRCPLPEMQYTCVRQSRAAYLQSACMPEGEGTRSP